MTNFQPIFICPKCNSIACEGWFSSKHHIYIPDLEVGEIQCPGKPVTAYLASDLVKMLKERIQEIPEIDYSTYKDKKLAESRMLVQNTKKHLLESLLREVEGGK